MLGVEFANLGNLFLFFYAFFRSDVEAVHEMGLHVAEVDVCTTVSAGFATWCAMLYVRIFVAVTTAFTESRTAALHGALLLES